MAFLAVDKNGSEYIYSDKPKKNETNYYVSVGTHFVELPKGTIKMIIGKELTFDNEPFELIKY